MARPALRRDRSERAADPAQRYQPADAVGRRAQYVGDDVFGMRVGPEDQARHRGPPRTRGSAEPHRTLGAVAGRHRRGRRRWRVPLCELISSPRGISSERGSWWPPPSLVMPTATEVNRHRSRRPCREVSSGRSPDRKADADECRDDHGQTKDPSERIDSSNELVTGPNQEGHIGKRADNTLGCSSRVQEVGRNPEQDEDEERDIRPLGHGEAPSLTIDERPANRPADKARARRGWLG